MKNNKDLRDEEPFAIYGISDILLMISVVFMIAFAISLFVFF